jgi:hypothetical protein
MTKVIKLTESELTRIVLKVINEMDDNSENENFIKDLLEYEGYHDLDIMYNKSYYSGNSPLTHVLEMYFVGKDGKYVRYPSGNAITTKLYFRVRNNEPYLIEMTGLPGNFLKNVPSHMYEKYFEEKGSEYLKRYSQYKGGFDNWR